MLARCVSTVLHQLRTASLGLVLGLAYKALPPCATLVVPPEAAVQVSGVRAPEEVRDVEPKDALVDVLDFVQPGAQSGGERGEVDEGEEKIARSKVEGRPGLVESQLDVVKGEGSQCLLTSKACWG